MRIHLYTIFLLLVVSLSGKADSYMNDDDQLKIVDSHLQQIETLKNQTRFLSFYINKVKNYYEAYCYPQSAAKSLATYGVSLNERFTTELSIIRKQDSDNCINLKFEYRESLLLAQELTLALKDVSNKIKSNLAILADLKLSSPDSKASERIDNYFKSETKSLNNSAIKKLGITTKQISLGLLTAIFAILVFAGLAMTGGMPLWVLGITLGSIFGAYFSVGKISELSSDKDKIKAEIQLSNELIKTYKDKLFKNTDNENFKVELSVSP